MQVSEGLTVDRSKRTAEGRNSEKIKLWRCCKLQKLVKRSTSTLKQKHHEAFKELSDVN
jgi:hypothetical protein